MRKFYWIVSLTLILSALFFFQVLPSTAADDGLVLEAPVTCPTTGCAAGQRLNFRVDFQISPQSPSPNTQVCVYAPSEGLADENDSPWADIELGWISEVGVVTGEPYQKGQVRSLCTDHTDEGDEWLIGAYANHKSGSSDQLKFAVQIHPDTEVDGYIKVKVLQAQANNSWLVTARYNSPISVAERADTVYVAQTPDDCDVFKPCYVNSADDLATGIGTGLRDAVMAVDTDDEILILEDYTIKGHGVLVDKKLTIRGHENAMITYVGNRCTNPMLMMTSGGTLSGLTINDNNCIIPSRTLVEVNSDLDVIIKQNTLTFGNHAIYIHDNSGNVTIAFNHIINNDNYAIFREEGDETGIVNIYANNINNNHIGIQVDCGKRGIANHNFWGQGLPATTSTASCTVSNAKQLGASIQLAIDNPGVQAERLNVTTEMSYTFDGKIGARRASGEDFDIIIVNHGQGSLSNIPFYQSGPAQIEPCSNYFDVFLANDAVASDLTLAFKYDLNNNCVTKIESQDYCGGTDSQKYPLWWYDPGTNVTDGWDRTGQNPQGPGAAGASGQETTCHLDLKEIRVNIDNTGRPSISTDLNFTPFVVGLPIGDAITFAEFTARFDGSRVNLRWITTSETNIKGFHVLRGETEQGVYVPISNLINAIGDTNVGGTYQFSDETITLARTYYYKIEVIDKNDNSVSTHGPVSILTITQTPTITLTRTPTLVPTATFFPTPTFIFYFTPTPWFIPRTATPIGFPTQIRTFGPTPEETNTMIPFPTIEGTADSYDPNFGPGYPSEWEETPTLTVEQPEVTERTPTPSPEPDPTPDPGGIDDEDELPVQNVRWIFIIVGAASGLSLIGAASVILARFRFG